MRIAIISDIHGNMEALASFTEQTSKEPYDELWVLGDLVNYGPDPGTVIDFVRSHATVVVRGNHDDAVGLNRDPRCSVLYREMAQETMRFTRSVLSADQIQYLANLPLTAERVVDGTKFVLCHAAPSDPLYKYIPANSPQWEQEIDSINTDFLLVGHTHTPFVRPAGTSVVVNPGSLGQPKTGEAKACWATWDQGVTLHSASYDLGRTLAKIDRMPIIETVREELKAVLRSGGLSTASGPLMPKFG